jgi:hypothetical protein
MFGVFRNGAVIAFLGVVWQAGRVARQGRNAAGVERTLAALRAGGRLEEVDAGMVALARHLADSLDVVDPAEHPAQAASLARVQLSTLRALRGAPVDDDDGIADLVAALSAPMGDAAES